MKEYEKLMLRSQAVIIKQLSLLPKANIMGDDAVSDYFAAEHRVEKILVDIDRCVGGCSDRAPPEMED